MKVNKKTKSKPKELKVKKSFLSYEMRFFNETVDYNNYNKKGIRK